MIRKLKAIGSNGGAKMKKIFLLIGYYVNKDLINGFTIYLGGMDGLIYSSYANKMFYELQCIFIYARIPISFIYHSSVFCGNRALYTLSTSVMPY